VTDLNCANRTLHNLTEKTAQGRFCVVTVRVTNIGDRTARVWPSSQRLFDDQGREYKADDWAGLYHAAAAKFTDNVSPGNAVTGALVYDAPAGSRFTKLVVRDFPLSRGTTITLR